MTKNDLSFIQIFSIVTIIQVQEAMNKSLSLATLTPQIVKKITVVRQYFLDYGYSQVEIESYFLRTLYDCVIEQDEDGQKMLIQKIKGMSSEEEGLEILSRLDMEASKIEALEKFQLEEAQAILRERIQQSKRLKDRKRMKERKMSKKDNMKRKDKKSTKEIENICANGDFKTPEELKKTNKNVCTGIFGLASIDSNSMEIFGGNSFDNPFMNDKGLREYRNNRESQKIAEKLLQIKILSEIMTSQNSEDRESKLRVIQALVSNPFMTRV